MATIIERKEDLQEHVEKILKHAGKLMHCIEEMDSYNQRKRRDYDEGYYRY